MFCVPKVLYNNRTFSAIWSHIFKAPGASVMAQNQELQKGYRSVDGIAIEL